MNIITLDFETHYSGDYSLSRMPTLNYIRDERFQFISCAIKLNHHPTDVVFGEAAIRRAFDSIQDTVAGGMLLAHNMSGFDAYICAYLLGLRPRIWGCTLAMARPIHAKTVGVGLAALVRHYKRELEARGIAGAKDNTALVQTRGKRLEDFTRAELEAMAEYNRNDTDQCWGLFQILRKHYTAAELWQIDTLTRMRTEPQFELDTALLETAASVERSDKLKELLTLAKKLRAKHPQAEDLDWGNEDEVTEFVRAELASAPRFAALLESLGTPVPMKPSPTNPDSTIPALAKTDEDFLALQDSDNPTVAAAARARLSVKSTLLETRIEKFLDAGSRAGGRLPVPLRYCGADTTGRDSGEEYNCQNLPRANPSKPRNTDALRKSLRAPRGKLVIVADQSGIELRVNHFLWKVPTSMALYRADPHKADLYRQFAGVMFSKNPEEVTSEQRQFGKICQLGLGFGSGAVTFRRIARVMGGLDLEPAAAENAVTTWRATYHNIVQGWRTCNDALGAIAANKEQAVDPWGLAHTSGEGIHLPSGRVIRYPDLHLEPDGQWADGREKTSWFYGQGRHKARIYGPKVVENFVQALARDTVFDAALEFYRRTGLHAALRVHDELVYVVDEARAQDLLDELQNVLRTPPTWWPELIVSSEGDIAPTYGEAK